VDLKEGTLIDTGLKDKVVLISGANNPRGIGAAAARELAGEGARVCITYLHLLPDSFGLSQKDSLFYIQKTYGFLNIKK
jgi:3-oxoacyl-[acyl-carrier protein] reductase